MDFPKIADARVGLEHRYGFSLSFEVDAAGSPTRSGLAKLDLRRGRSGRRVKLPQWVPYGFHGSWVPDQAG